ncbi:pyridoxamine 5'-phosphate oxidase family protein [Natronorubrum sulfidifaciens]|uniref:Flavin-nucleotide-binding protein-like protein n=1 Tax=Natronorubrum sulfidifaciens JCM 14089 TaxID=1230460 RepID=L9VUG8_9EURY|nr:pyridoxamine 5'-phosphate oxidase family protein [Natronorubrum sulfidifaciens]ELY40671.1 flavin-nucleotide-binding protein-like protein [Natronorubrum sulfidifaciens JCM 14089]
MTTDTLRDYGVVRMDDDEIRNFLSSQSVGVLGLPTDDAPVLRPMSFWFDGESCIYILYVLGSSSRKAERTDSTAAARFLVYRADTPFNWTSVLLTGSITAVPERERETIREDMEIRWRPDVFEQASTSATTELYRLEIEEQAGVKHLGLPSGFEPDSSDDQSA